MLVKKTGSVRFKISYQKVLKLKKNSKYIDEETNIVLRKETHALGQILRSSCSSLLAIDRRVRPVLVKGARMHLPRIVTNIRARWTCVAADGVIEMVDYNKCTQHFVVFIDTL